ncbi:histidine phosphatase superfamily [Cladorrhinum sp. PSN332]|nr:histidine phosphatase superfamily [Cladorrhinum sp. PSN332]
MDSLRSLLGGDNKSPIYTSLPDDDVSAGQNQRRTTIWRNQNKRKIKLVMAAMLVISLGFLALVFLQTANGLPTSKPSNCDTPELGYQCNTSISHSWGQYSPYFSVPSGELDPSIPKDCTLTFALILSRHGARDPTFGKTVQYAALITKIQERTTSYKTGYEFLKTYNYSLGSDHLTRFGQQQLVNSGIKFYNRYSSLVRSASTHQPFIRAADQDRVVMSAQNFTQGFHRALVSDSGSLRSRPPGFRFDYPILTIPEGDVPNTNNTLSHGLCKAFEKPGKYSTVGSEAQAVFISIFAPGITARLNDNLQSANLTDADTISLMDMCPFATVASPSSSDSKSFCSLFTQDEWKSYDYYQNLGKYYGYGPGNPLGPTQGVGYVNELIARLTKTPVSDGTSTNSTLDGDERTFPLDREVYADFSHDNDMVGILSALGVWEGVGELDKEKMQRGGFSAAESVAFGGRVYVEKMRCERVEEEYVRVLVNDRVVGFKERCGGDEYGRCGLKKFVDGLRFAREGGRWGECFE